MSGRLTDAEIEDAAKEGILERMGIGEREPEMLQRLRAVAHTGIAFVSGFGTCGAAEDGEAFCTYDDCEYCAFARTIDLITKEDLAR